LISFFGTASSIVIAELIVPPDTPPFSRCEVIDDPTSSGVGRDLRVLFERYAQTSEGIESYPQEGTIMEPVLVAR
jgi:hypothetical protein